MKLSYIFISGFLFVGALICQADRPNIVFLLSDDQCSYSMGCYGNPDVLTPNLDQLSDEGITFDRHYNTTSICMASRANVMMGMYEYKTGCNFSHGEVMNEMWQLSYPVLLREAGYTTAFAGKFGFEIRETPTGGKLPYPASDFDWWAGAEGQSSYTTANNPALSTYASEYPHSTLAYGAFGGDFIRDAATNSKPFCLSISFKAPHRPTTPDPRFDAVYAGKVFQKPANYGRDYGTHFSDQSKTGRQYERFITWNYDDDYDNVMATYNQQVYGIDQAVGMIRSALVEAGVADNTIVIYTSDNGFLCGSHGYGSKVLPYEESARVPLIIYDPRHANSGAQLRSESLTGNIDFAPTILHLAGVPVPERMDGRDLMPLYNNPTGEVHQALSLINVWGTKETHALAVMTKDLKYIYWGYAGETHEVTEELYHVGEDPLELVNRAVDPAHSNELNTMRQLYDNQLAHWKAETVPYNNYHKYATYFDRNVDWETRNTGPYPPTAVRLQLDLNPTAIRFNTNLDRQYQLLMRTNLVDSGWIPVGASISSDGTPESIGDSNAFPNTFYCIEEIEPSVIPDPGPTIPVVAVSQSSDHSAAYPATKATDGDPATFSHTSPSSDPADGAYWEMTFGGNYEVETVELINRAHDTTAPRLNNCNVWIYNSANQVVWTSAPISGASNGSVHSLSIPAGQIGNRVRVGLAENELNGNGDSVICLAEVKAWGMVARAPAAIVSNGDLNSDVPALGSADGDTVYSLDILTGNVQEDGVDTAVSENEWLLGTQTRGLVYSATGGNGGGGAFVQNAANDFNNKARAVLQFANNGKTTTGIVDISMDVFFDDNAGGLRFNVELYGWNSGDTGPGLSAGGKTVNVITYVNTILNDATLLLNVPLAASDFADAAWSTATVSNSFDLGTGYDYYAWRIGVVGATAGDAFAFDNVTVGVVLD